MKIGLKGLSWATALTFILLYILTDYAYYFQKIVELDPLTALFAGIFTTILTVIVYRVTKPHRGSNSYINITNTLDHWDNETHLLKVKEWHVYLGKNLDRKATELRPSTIGVLIFTSFLLITFLTVERRDILLLNELPQELMADSNQYCKDEEQEKEDDRPECQLIRRAYDLGYAKDLGSCSPFKDGPPKVCYLRQKEEPYLHYAYRLLSNSYKLLDEAFSKDSRQNFLKDFYAKEPFLKELANEKISHIKGEPRSLHVVWTNLPTPMARWKQKFNDIFRPQHCITRYQGIPNRLEVDSGDEQFISKSFDHAVGHLVFEPKYKRVVGNCKEYVIQWNSPVNSCKQLAENPHQFLKSQKLDKKVNFIVNRYRDLETTKPVHRKSFDIKKVLSFNCFMYGVSEEKNFRIGVTLDNEIKLTAQVAKVLETEVDSQTQIKMFKNVAQMFSRTFSYSALQSQSNFQVYEKLEVGEALFDHDTFPFSRLSFLQDSDVFLEPSWIQQREDIMAIYPYYLHQFHFVDHFRTIYKTQKGRL